MARPDKAAAVAELTEEFRSSNGAVLTEYRGLSVKQLQDLRRSLGENATYAVVKNTLTKIAAREAGMESVESLLSGPSAIAFIKGDAVEAAKKLRDFARANPPLVIKGGLLDGKPLSIDEISRLADLESREVLLAKLAGALLASLQNAASLFNAPLSQMARLTAALQDKAEQDPSVLAGGAGSPADTSDANASVTADDAPAAESDDTGTADAESSPGQASGDDPSETAAPSEEGTTEEGTTQD
jgi:large subunit ribosomal protein L10